MEHFYTLQGEGFHAGKPAYFVRLAGCDVGCVWCDVKESWHTEGHPVLTVKDILATIQNTPAKIVVITGGEPLMHDLNPLTTVLKNVGLKLHIETAGSSPMSGDWDWICLSPKKFKEPLAESIIVAHELKSIIYNKHDFEWANKFAPLVNEKCILYLQPEWSKRKEVETMIIEYIKQSPQWQLSLQTHKYLEIP